MLRVGKLADSVHPLSELFPNAKVLYKYSTSRLSRKSTKRTRYWSSKKQRSYLAALRLYLVVEAFEPSLRSL
jgi:hypothetical protein